MGPGHRRNDSAGLPLPRAAHVQEGTSAGRHHASARRPARSFDRRRQRRAPCRPRAAAPHRMSFACGRPSPDLVRLRPLLTGLLPLCLFPESAPLPLPGICPGRPSPDLAALEPPQPWQTTPHGDFLLEPVVANSIAGGSKNLLLLQQDATSSK